MIDASANLYNALPLAYGAARTASTRTLAKPAENLSSGNSLNTIATELRANANISDFSSPPPNEQGFASLNTTLASLRLSPEQLAPPPSTENDKPVWEQLLEQQETIAESRREALREQQERLQARRQAAAEQAFSETRVRELGEAVVFNSDQSIPADQNSEEAQEQQNQPEPAPLLGQNDQQESLTLAVDQGRVFPPDTEFPKPVSYSIPEVDKPEIQSPPQQTVEQQRVQQLYNTAPSSQQPGGTVNLFA